MRILNLGNCIKNGNYKLHSQFKSVHNYTSDQEFVSLVTTEVGNGPNNIVLNNFPITAEPNLTVSQSTISVGNTALVINQTKPQTEENILITDTSTLTIAIEILTEKISKIISPKSLGFLLFPDNEIYFQSTFEKAMLHHVKEAIHYKSWEDLPAISKSMNGVGFGLTPSGDDFNCGVLYALNYLNTLKNYDLSGVIKKCYTNSIGNNLISNTFLKFAYLNRYYENFYNLLKALEENNKTDISYYTYRIVGSGHTSGSDMLTGFILTMRYA